MNDQDKAFLDSRRRRLAFWPWIGWGLLLGLVALAAYIAVEAPLLARPGYAMDRLAAGSLRREDIELAAAILPVVTWMSFNPVAVGIGLGFGVVANERRYQRIIAALLGDADRRAPL